MLTLIIKPTAIITSILRQGVGYSSRKAATLRTEGLVAQEATRQYAHMSLAGFEVPTEGMIAATRNRRQTAPRG